MLEKVNFIKLSSIGPRGLLNFYRREPMTVIKNIMKIWPLYLHGIFPELPLTGHTDYVRFIILGRSRTGSNLLRGSLMSHNRIVVLGDIFRKYTTEKPQEIYWGLPFYPQTKKMITQRQKAPCEFLDKDVFIRFPLQVATVGFKVLYPHAHPPSWMPVLDYLVENKEIKVLHIKRKNILKTHLSLKKVGGQKDKWANISGTVEEQPALTLDYQDCLAAFENTRHWETEHDRLFQDHPKLEVFYEDIAADYDGQLQRIQEFLGVDYGAVKPLTYKQSSQPLETSIENYFELKEKFENTPWATFFQD